MSNYACFCVHHATPSKKNLKMISNPTEGEILVLYCNYNFAYLCCRNLASNNDVLTISFT